MSLSDYVSRDKWVAFAIAGIVFLSLLPQVRFWIARGSEWRGSYAILQPDEVLYSAYVNALIDGRPRRTDPSTGEDDHPQSPLPESLFSIQIVPPYVIALAARLVGATASSAFIALLGIAGLLTSLSLFWLFNSLTGDRNFAASALLVVLCFGALAGGHGVVGLLATSQSKFLGLPFLRRYEPAAPLPLVFVFITLIWQALTTQRKRAANLKALFAGGILGVLIFSYFYLWTAAFAWLVGLGSLWIILRRGEARTTIRLLIIVATPVILALALYLYLIATLPQDVAKAQILTYSRWPDLFRIPEIIGYVTLVLLSVIVWRRKIPSRSPQVIFAGSFALLPLLVFNQQLLSGRSIQPFHYEVLIVNYIALIGLIMVLWFRTCLRSRTLLLIASLALVWGLIEVDQPYQVQQKLFADIDEMVPVLLRLKEEAEHDGTWEGLHSVGQTPGSVFSPHYGISQVLPLWAPQGSLLAPGSESFQGLSENDRKERLFSHFYYCGKNQTQLRELLIGGPDPFLTMKARSILFGVERVTPVLGPEFKPIRPEEIEREVESYEAFAGSFSRKQLQKIALMYAITRVDTEFDFFTIDLWYERDKGSQVGRYMLYRLRARN